MPDPDAVEWDRRYTREPHLYAHKSPRPLLTRHLDLLPARGLALDAACGAAASGLFLARRGWHVIGLDASEAGLRLAQSRARKESLPLSLAVMDLSDPWLPAGRFDLVLNFYFLMRPLWATYKKALKPGGLLFFETFLWQEGEESRREFFPQPGELRAAFSGWELLHYDESPRRRDAQDQRIVVSMVARK